MPAPKDPPPPPPVRAEKLDGALVVVARREVESALASANPILRCHAIEVIQNTLRDQARTALLNSLKDKEAPVRFASAMAIGQLELTEAKDQLARMINDPDQRVGIAVRFALHRIGNPSYTKDLQEFSRDPQPPIRADTALVLGLLKEPTATRVLRPMQRDRESAVRLQVAEALWRLGDLDALKTLVASAQSNFADEQAVAVMALAAPRDPRVLGHVRSALVAPHEEVQLVAARAMGILGSDAGYAIAIAATKSQFARQRFLAALALGAIGRTDAQEALRPLFRDPDPEVRLCAAQAILQWSMTR